MLGGLKVRFDPWSGKTGETSYPPLRTYMGERGPEQKNQGSGRTLDLPHVSMFGPRVNVIEVASPAITAE